VDRARVDRYPSLTIVPVQVSLTILVRENLQALGKVCEGVLRRELDRETRKVVFGRLLLARLIVRAEDHSR
jgi:hypothetical protein